MSRFTKNAVSLAISFLIMLVLVGCDLLNPPEKDGVSLSTAVSNYQDVVLLGKGYDVFSEYANSQDVKEQILDLEALDNANMLLRDDNVESGEFLTITGSSLSEYQDQLSGNVQVSGDYKLFKSEVKTNFSSIGAKSTYYQFATVRENIKKVGYYLNKRTMVDVLKEYLDPTFAQHLNDSNYAPQDLFRNYGTHCLTGIIMGARLNYNLTVRKKESTSQSDIGTYAKSSFKGLFASADITVSGDKKWSDYFYTDETNISMKVYGGKAEYAQGIQNDNDYKDWINSIADHPVFMDFYKNGLLPLWEFCDSDARKNQIKAAFDTYAAANQISIPQPATKFEFQVPKVECTKSTDPNGGDGGVEVWITGDPNNTQIYYTGYNDWGQDKMTTGKVVQYPSWYKTSGAIQNNYKIKIRAQSREFDSGYDYKNGYIYLSFDESNLKWRYNTTQNAEFKYLSANQKNSITLDVNGAGGDTNMRFYFNITPMPQY